MLAFCHTHIFPKAMRYTLLLFVCLLSLFPLAAQDAAIRDRILQITPARDVPPQPFVYESRLRREGWDSLTQVQFWRRVMRTSPDYGYVSKAANREILVKMTSQFYDTLSYTEQNKLKDSIRRHFDLPSYEVLYVTFGRKDFYQIPQTLPNIHRAIPIFEAEGIPAWYAQSILLIESPGMNRVSPDGAAGPFQLMKSVAIEQGLKVNSKTDEREDFDKAASASARFFRNVCLPETRKILQSRGIPYDESAVWFRLLVLHVYHAGAGNVGGAVKKMKNRTGGQEFIEELWQTKYRGFGNASQNYSQVALAANLELEAYVRKRYKVVARRTPNP